MANGLQLLEAHIEQKNDAVEAFVADAEKIRKAIDKGSVKGRSPVKLENDSFYRFTLLNQPLKVEGKDKALELLSKLIKAAYDEKDTDFRGVIENTYGGSSVAEGQPKRRGRKPKGSDKKAVMTGQDNGIDRSID